MVISYCMLIMTSPPYNCGTLSDIIHGSINYNTAHSVAKYECDRGYNLDGDPYRRCLSDGTWSSQAPACFRIEALMVGTVELLPTDLICKYFPLRHSSKVYQCK